MRRSPLLFLTLSLLLISSYPISTVIAGCDPNAPITRISVASDGTQGNGSSSSGDISSDGNYVVFQSFASNLVANDGNQSADIFVYNRQTCTTTRVSINPNGMEFSGDSWSPSISSNGDYVAFHTGGQVYIHSRVTNTTSLVSSALNAAPGNAESVYASVNGNGESVAFESVSTDLVNGDTNNASDIFIRDQQMTRVSVSSNGIEGNGLGASLPSVSDDGRYIVFHAFSNNLVVNDSNNVSDIFVHDRQLSTTRRISVSTNGTQGNGTSLYGSISGNGRYIAFYSEADNLVVGDTNDKPDIFIHDVQTGVTSRISISSSGEQSNDGSIGSSLSHDGHFVAFSSSATNIITGDTNNSCDLDGDLIFAENCPDAFIHNRQTGQTIRISVGLGGIQGNLATQSPVVSSNGQFAVFSSNASNLVAGDTNGTADVFLVSVVFPSLPVFSVTKTADTNDGTCDADCSLREAITAANANPSSTVNIPAGTYTITRPGADEDNNATGDFDINAAMIINGAGAATTIIDGGQLDRIFHVVGAYAVNISGLTIQNGKTTAFSAGLYNMGGSMILTNCIVSSNQVVNELNDNAIGGGGVANEPGSFATISGCTITNNTSNINGGGIANGGSMIIINSSVTGNSVTSDTGYGGGGIYSAPSAPSLEVIGSVISNNTAALVGGIWNYGNTINVANSTISNNSDGALYTGGGFVTNTTFVGNTTDTRGGAISTFGNPLVVKSSTFVNNSATIGGGAIWAWRTETSFISITNSTFSGNNAPVGGAILAGDDDEPDNSIPITIDHSTFNDNTAGGAVYVQDSASVTIRASLLGTNTGGNCVFSPTSGGIITSTGYNISADTSCNTYFTAISDLNNTNPLLVALADNGGPTQTMALLNGSPAINRVPIANCTLTTDQRGFIRPTGNGCDSGAFEAGDNLPPASTPGAAPQRNYFTTSTPTLTWSRVTTAASYIIEVDTDRNFTAPFAFRATGITSTSITTDPLPDNTYYWRVRMVNASGVPSMWSLVDSFVVDAS